MSRNLGLLQLFQPSMIKIGLWLIREKSKSMFIWGKQLWSCAFKGAYWFHRTSCINFCLKSIVLNPQKHLQRSHFFMVNQHSQIHNFIFQKFQSTVRGLRFNETNLALRNAFILDLFALGGQKQSKYDERTPFGGSLQKHDLSVNPQLPKTHMHVFLNYFSFRCFLAFLLFLDIKSSFIQIYF